jgi:hypothetical protein
MSYPQMERTTYAIAKNRDLIARVHMQRRGEGEIRHGSMDEALSMRQFTRISFLISLFRLFGEFQLQLRNENWKRELICHFFDSSPS